MSPYRRLSLMRMKWLRRFVYGRGHGVHSPLAYNAVLSLLRPYAGYYVESEDIALVACEEEMVWFRMLARLSPGETKYELLEEGLFRAMEEYAFTNGRPASRRKSRLLVTDSREDATLFLSSGSTDILSVVLYIGVRDTGESEQSFLQFLDDFHRGVVLDFFSGALIFDNNDERYYYRTTL